MLNRISIESALHTSGYFWIASLILLAGSTILFYMLWRKALKKQQLLVEKMVNEKALEIEKMNAELKHYAEEIRELNALTGIKQQLIEEQSEKIQTQKDKLQVAKAIKDKLFIIMTQDLRNPFNAILGYSGMLTQNYDNYSREKSIKIINSLHHSLKSINQFLEHIMYWSRSQLGGIKINAEKINIYNLIFEAIEIFGSGTEIKNNNIIIDIDKNLVFYADKNILNTIMHYLVLNAIKYTCEGVIIVRGGKTKNDELLIEVEDTGNGMDEETTSNLFNIEMISSTEGTGGEKGTGLGLIICKEYIELHKGKIWVKSIKGKGTIFFFTISELIPS